MNGFLVQQNLRSKSTPEDARFGSYRAGHVRPDDRPHQHLGEHITEVTATGGGVNDSKRFARVVWDSTRIS